MFRNSGRTIQNQNGISAVVCIFLVIMAVAVTANAETIPVTNTDDSGLGSLRQAIVDANNWPGADTIVFDTAGVFATAQTITLTSGPLIIDSDVTIQGPGANQLTISGGGVSGVFVISTAIVTLDGLTVSGGNGSTGSGGGIVNDLGTVTVRNAVVSGNNANLGGGIYNDGTLTISNSTISSNNALYGGGILNFGGLTISNSTISGNSATYVAAGILNNYPGQLTIGSSTIVANSAWELSGGGITSEGITGSLIINSSIVAKNTAVFGVPATDIAALDVSGDFNLIQDASNISLPLPGSNNITGVDPLLGPLADNGGPTPTHALLPGSPAIDWGKNIGGLTTDQRSTGFVRTFDDPTVANAVDGDGTDIGAFEAQPPPVVWVCPLPQGYWKNNSDAWPVDSLSLGGETYTQAELLSILNTPTGTGKNSDASLILADQLIAATLSIANGSDPAPISAAIAAADALLAPFTGLLPYKVKASSAVGQQMITLAALLEQYNKGLLTAGCTP